MLVWKNGRTEINVEAAFWFHQTFCTSALANRQNPTLGEILERVKRIEEKLNESR